MTRLKRLVGASPVLAALVFQAIALDRWIVALPVVVALVVVVVRDISVPASSSTLRWYIAGGIGFAVGVALLAISVPPSGLLPPVVVSALTGLLIGLAVLAVLTQNVAVAWTSAWLLVSLCGQVALTSALGIALSVFVGASLLSAWLQAGIFRGGSRSVAPLGLFVAGVVLATFGTAAAVRKLDGVFLKTMETLFTENAPPVTTGIGREIRMSARSSIKLSRRPLMDLSAETGLLRAYVMDQFDGLQWSTSSKLRGASNSLTEVPVRTASERRVEMVPLDDLVDSLPSPAGTWEVRGATPRVEGGWVLRGDTEAAELTLIGDDLERLPEEAEPGAEYLMVPEELKEGLGAVADKLTRTDQTSREKVSQIEAFFHDNFEYSLETDLIGPQSPLVTFVEERRPAYCVYFAGAMAVMLRTQGIPSRVVSGYAPTEVNPLTGRVTIRQRDAHAWVEAWLPDEQRFVAFDPTPARSRERVLDQSDDPGLISAVFGAAASILRRTWFTLQRDPAGWLAGLVVSPFAWALVLGSLCVLAFRRRKGRKARESRGPRIESSDPLLRQAHRRYVRSLQREGVTPQPWETEEELLARLSEEADRAIASAAAKFIASYRRARFSGDMVDPRLMELAKLDVPDQR